MDEQKWLEGIVEDLERTGRFVEQKRFVQHGRFSVYDHCLYVARTALRLAARWPFALDREALVRGALLHDYFLYDWHVPDPHRPKHAFFHPRVALEKARQDYAIGRTEADIILHHMFPLVPVPPATPEGWIVCLADTWCAVRETLGHGRLRGIARRRLAKPGHGGAG